MRTEPETEFLSGKTQTFGIRAHLRPDCVLNLRKTRFL
jgi:hypothetical protein